MTTITFDTLEFAEELKAAGIPDEQAKAQTRALSRALESKGLAAQYDVERVRRDMATKDDIAKLDKELAIIKWMLALVIVVTVIPALKSLFIP
ncbi:MAG: DUF1640 domain-containing protein [Magnetococcales bacterium]|nr:DUF1640 domain-containing protein [Magnetococcales bacterium]